ncbi:Asp-tRNA(Asn)/Glu-tRNA(Gln) amidotransferase subunit GatC [Candidatus Microgenomates bacterium]|nr:Asp-tRNA(Asn)/Glu-tRNA(Gln) amidotransferase subunit GatC [Candidatus Microgenomates bacterium]
MAKVNARDIKHLGQLARIGLAEADIKRMGSELQAILGYVEKLQAVDTTKIKPTNQVTGLTDIWRQDRVWDNPWNREELLKNAPHSEDGFIKVPKVL